MSLRDSSPEFLECQSVSISDFNSITLAKPIFSPPGLYIRATTVDQKQPASSQTFHIFGVILLSHRFEGMENGKRSAEEAFNGSVSPRQRLRHQEGATQDAPIILEHRVNSAQLLGSSSSMIRRPLPCYPRKQIDNDDLMASIDQASQKLTDCLSIVKSALSMAPRRSPSEANQVEERLAKAEARIMGEMPTIIFYLFLIFVFKILIIPSSNLSRSISPVGKPLISYRVRSRIRQC